MLSLIRKFMTLLMITIALPILLWAAGFIVFTASIYLMGEPNTDKHLDGAIVLTGGSNRVSKGLDLLADGKISNLLVSGVHKDVEIRDIMKLWGKKSGAPPCCIILGREAGNTIGNAQEAKKWIEHEKIHEVYLITANYHIPRAMMEFNHHIPNVKIIAFPVKPEHFNPDGHNFWRTDFLEYNKLLATLARILFFPEETQPLPLVLQK